MNTKAHRPAPLYGGAYTADEIALCKRLYQACIKQTPDFAEIEALLRQGADPLGPADGDLDIDTHIYGELLTEAEWFEEGIHLPRITELFLRYGMDIDKPRIPYDDDDSLNPMWIFTFVMNEYSAAALKLLLDSGLSADAVGEMWGHAVDDICISRADPCGDEWDCETCTLKHIMLCASYPHIIDNDEYLRAFLMTDSNSYDLQKFRAWDDFSYSYEAPNAENGAEGYIALVKISEKASGKEVWRFVL